MVLWWEGEGMEGQALSTGPTGMMRGPQPSPLKARSRAEGPCAVLCWAGCLLRSHTPPSGPEFTTCSFQKIGGGMHSRDMDL